MKVPSSMTEQTQEEPENETRQQELLPINKESQFRTKKITFFFLSLLLIGSVGLDQLTKALAEKHLMVWQDTKNIGYYQGQRYHLTTLGYKEKDPSKSFYTSFAFNYVRNQGAAWGVFSDLDEKIRTPLFHLITILATLFIIMYWRATPASHRLARFSLALIFSGAIGNFIDRFRRGFVVDFLDVSWSFPLPFNINFSIDWFPEFLNFLNLKVNTSYWAYDFPKFNWADSCITVGVSLLILDMVLFEGKRSQLLLKEQETKLKNEQS